jgi:hypothetical protein
MSVVRLLAAAALLAATAGSTFAAEVSVSAASKPRWVAHVERFRGGISNGVRFTLDQGLTRARANQAAAAAKHPHHGPGGGNVQMNDDSFPEVPQNEESVAYSTDDPFVAVAAANDYVSEGVVVMRTKDGGRHWASTRIIPVFFPTRDVCTGSDPAVAYSSRDHAFYLSTLCFFRTLPVSEVQVYVSLDDGETWTPGRQAAVAATNYDSATDTVDDTLFNDKEYMTVDNNRRSAHYGRIYVSFTRFHLLPNGSSDSCPIQLSYTDSIPAQNPRLSTWSHTQVVPDGSGGVGESANQFSVPVVERNGTLDIAYVLEECNTSLDHGLRFQKSTNGGVSFLASAVTVNKPGQWVDNSDPDDLLPSTAFRAPNTVSLAYSRRTGRLAYVYANYRSGQGNGNIDVSLSDNGGMTWSDARTISLEGHSPAPNNQFFPWIAATPQGRFVAIWLDRRQDPANHDIGTFEAWSDDNGDTWRNRRISTETWDPDFGFFTSGAFIGDYSGLAANDTVIYPSWTDGRASNIANTGIGETDVFTDVDIQHGHH